MEINESQKQAINHYKGPAMVLAGPGSGKTFVITRRLQKLIINKKVNPENVLVITFTRAAANEMKERFVKLLADEKIRLDVLPSFGTFHSIFFGILKDNFGYSSDSLIKDDEERQYLISILEKDKDIELSIENANLILSDIKAYKIAQEKGEKFAPKYLSKDKFDEIYEKYRNLLFNKKKLDFHDMIENCRDMLINHKEVLDYYREKYSFILIDEFQDINQEQYDIIKLICGSNNLFVVGDDDQSIYKFRGSRPKVMFDFQDDYKKAKLIILDRNYRCAKNIVSFSKKVINNNKERFKKSLKSDRKEKGLIHINAFEDSNEENDYVVSIIKNILYNRSEMEQPRVAILYRTNILSISLVSRLRKENIDFYMKDAKTNIFDQFAISDIVSYLKIINGSNDIEDYTKIINKPVRYVSRTAIGYKKCSIDSLKKYYKDKSLILKNINKLENDIYLTKNINVALAIRYIRQNIGYEKYLIDYCKSKGIDYIEIKDLLDELEEECVRFNNINQFLQYIDEYKDTLEKEKANEKSPIHLMTFHSSKGLEFENVIIIDTNDGLIPHKKSIKQKDIETERRLFYVALTRAKDNLYILFTKKRNGKSYRPSRFILEGVEEGKNGRKEKSTGR